VTGNQFTTRGVDHRAGNFFEHNSVHDLIDNVGEFDKSSAFAAAVSIFNLGINHELFFKLFDYMHQASIDLDVLKIYKYAIGYSAGVLKIPYQPPGICRFKRFLPYGKILFTNNICNLELLESGWGHLISSVAMVTQDDIAFHNNQCDTNTIDDFLLSQAYLLGTTLRETDNRFEEGLFNSLYSAISTGLILNRTDDNISTHCIKVIDGYIQGTNLVPHTTVLWQHIYNWIENVTTSVCDTLT
jgi:hypothetical protein